MEDTTRESLERIERRLASLERKVAARSSNEGGVGCCGLILFLFVIGLLVQIKELVEALGAAG